MRHLLPLLLAAALPAGEVLVTDFSADLPGGQDQTLVLRLDGLGRLRPGGSSGLGLTVFVQRRGGAWAAEGHRAMADWNERSDAQVTIDRLSLADDGAISGRLDLQVWHRDNRLPAGTVPEHADTINVTLDGRVGTDLAVVADDPLSSKPPWRKEVPLYGGRIVSGTWKGSVSVQPPTPKVKKGEAPAATPPRVVAEGEGALAGALNAAPVPGRFGPEGNCVATSRAGGGVDLLLRLSGKRVSSPHGARLVKTWDAASDWNGSAGLRLTVSAPQRRDDVTLGIGLREADGTWYSVAGAARLRTSTTVFEVPWSDFRRCAGWDEDYAFSPAAINGLWVGIDDPSGVGDVRAVIHRIDLLPGPTPSAPTATLTVDDATLTINGTTEVPKGLFGFHDVNPALKAEEGKPDPFAYVQSLRPGYLRRVDHTGFGGKELSDAEAQTRLEARRQALAGMAEPISAEWRRAIAAESVDMMLPAHSTNLWARPGWMDDGIEKWEANVRAFYRQFALDAWIPGDQFNTRRQAEVWNEPFMWGRHINLGDRNPAGKKAWTDPTQHGYLPADLGAEAYARLFIAADEGAAAINPHLKLGGPSAPGFPEDDYTSFFNYTARILDRLHDRLDFITEHHYQGEPDAYAASYLVATAYLDVRHQRRLPIWNTECNDLADTPTKGDKDQPPPWSLKADQLNRAHYNLKDILSCLRVCPDIAQARAMHALWSGFCNNPGETHCYQLLSRLRGRLIAWECNDPAILAGVSSPAPGRLEIVLFNDSIVPRTVRLALPAGFALADATRLVFNDGTALVDERPDLATLRLEGRQGLRLGLDRADWTPAQQRQVVSHFLAAAKDDGTPDRTRPLCHVRLAPDQGLTTVPVVATTAATTTPIRRAWLRLVTRSVDRDEITVSLGNGQNVAGTLVLPWSSANEGCAVAQDLAIDPAWLAQTAPDRLRLTFAARDPATADGCTIYAAALYVER